VVLPPFALLLSTTTSNQLHQRVRAERRTTLKVCGVSFVRGCSSADFTFKDHTEAASARGAVAPSASCCIRLVTARTCFPVVRCLCVGISWQKGRCTRIDAKKQSAPWPNSECSERASCVIKCVIAVAQANLEEHDSYLFVGDCILMTASLTAQSLGCVIQE
jgi:hypothetical protein